MPAFKNTFVSLHAKLTPSKASSEAPQQSLASRILRRSPSTSSSVPPIAPFLLSREVSPGLTSSLSPTVVHHPGPATPASSKRVAKHNKRDEGLAAPREKRLSFAYVQRLVGMKSSRKGDVRNIVIDSHRRWMTELGDEVQKLQEELEISRQEKAEIGMAYDDLRSKYGDLLILSKKYQRRIDVLEEEVEECRVSAREQTKALEARLEEQRTKAKRFVQEVQRSTGVMEGTGSVEYSRETRGSDRVWWA
ncbi:hypothetical protein OE88DRAFT_1727485 [Heliocybe sulcata]|uniref:Uncharacterized protein n=1 Tax=Heliocybe sulcata TaxID=5364 RepID=A0A5C3MT99_9AGAM|nr:hypothetical protein OE88DRAFT_1727485 [Heliocybe sulcata]